MGVLLKNNLIESTGEPGTERTTFLFSSAIAKIRSSILMTHRNFPIIAHEQ